MYESNFLRWKWFIRAYTYLYTIRFDSFSKAQKAATTSQKQATSPRSPARGFGEITHNNQTQLKDKVSSQLHRKQMGDAEKLLWNQPKFDKGETRSDNSSAKKQSVFGEISLKAPFGKASTELSAKMKRIVLHK